VLGIVHDILHGELIVSLPGIGNFGYVKLNSISKVYSDLLKNSNDGLSSKNNKEVASLFEMFRKGHLVRCKVLNFSDNKLFLTIEPHQVNSNLTFKHLEKEQVRLNI
jgi:hypothetical protein